MLAGENVLETARRAFDDGPSAYIQKPYDPEGLRDAIRRLFIKAS
jgi:DNA-binding NtrC family response regulator